MPFESNARTVSLLTLLSRVTGLLRDAAIGRIFGVGRITDAFFFAFMIPNLFRRLFGEGALAAAFLPTYARLHRDDPAAARALATLTIGRLLIVLGAVTVVGEALLFGVSAMNGHGNLAVRLMMLTLPYMPLVCLVAILGAMLQVHGRFGPTAAAPIVLNACLIVATLGFASFYGTLDDANDDARARHISLVAGSIVIAGMLQVAWSWWALRRTNWRDADAGDGRAPFRDVLRQAGPMILGLGVLQLNTFFDGLIASYPTAVGPTIFDVEYPLQQGAMASVSYAQRLYQFPLGVFGIAVATAIFPLLAKQSNDLDQFRDTLRRGLRLVIFIGLPASVGLLLVAEPLIAVILQGGTFDADDTSRVAFILRGYATAVWAYSLTHVLTRAFYAMGDSVTPVKVALGVVLLNLTLNCTLIWTPLREAGLAWSTAISALVQSALLILLARRRWGTLIDADVTRSWMKSIVVTLVMAGLVAGAMWLMPTPETWTGALTTLIGATIVGAGGVFGLASLLRMPERWWALGASRGG